MKKLLSILLICGFALCVKSQTVSVKGKVVDESGLGMPGVFIKHKQSNKTVPSDLDGNYTIIVDNSQTAILQFSFVGFRTQEVAVSGKTIINVQLETEISKLNEVVVTALGIKREAKSLGYSRQSVNVEEMTEARDPNITNLLTGKVSGLQITTSGQPTGSTRVVLRGVNSLTGNNQPLWVVDGVPIDNSQGQIGDLDYGNGAADLNPDDIENIEVLKGPNAAALYGSRAVNGAILITTKKGSSNGDNFGVSFSSNLMLSSVYEFLSYQNIYGEGNGNRTLLNNIDKETGAFRQGDFGFSYGVPMLGQPYKTFSGVIRPLTPQPNNIKDLYQTSYRATQNVSISKADQNSSLRLSYTYYNGNDVIVKQNIDKRHTLSLNASKDFKSFLKVETRFQYTSENVDNRTFRNLNANSPLTSNVFFIRSAAVSDLNPYKDENGRAFGLPLLGYENPYWSINENFNQDRKNRFIGGLTTTIGLTKFLKFRAQISADLLTGDGFVFLERDGIISPTGSYSNFTQNNQNWNTEGLLMFNKQFKEFSLTSNLGGNLRSQNYYRNTASTQTLAAQDLMNISNSGGFVLNQELLTRSKVNSVFGNTTIGYKGLVYLDLTARNDWSSTLPKSNWSFFYPSVSSSFILSDIFKLPKAFSYVKLRASLARVGNDANPYNLFSAFNYAGTFNGNAFVDFDDILRSSNLKPEQTTSQELGTEMRLFKGKVSLDATVYKSSSVNQIFQARIPSEKGFSQTLINAGEIQNKGLELTLNADLLKKKNFSWRLTTNYSVNRNKIISLSPGIDRFVLGSYSDLTVNAEVGKPIGTLIGTTQYKASTGEIIVQNNGIPFTEPSGNLGNFLPDWLGSLGSNFKYKSFDLGFNFNVKMGGELYSASNFRANTAGNTIASLIGRDENLFSFLVLGEGGNELRGTTTLYNLPYPDAARAKGLKIEGFFPKLGQNGEILLDANGRMIPGEKSNVYLQTRPYLTALGALSNVFDASYIKLNQLILGYTMPKNLLKKTPFQSARVSFVGRNLWILYRNTPRGIDPESASSSGNLQGIEQGGSLPFANYGVDFKFTF